MNLQPKTAILATKKERTMKAIIALIVASMLCMVANSNAAHAACDQSKLNAWTKKRIKQAKACKKIDSLTKRWGMLQKQLAKAGCSLADVGLPADAANLCKKQPAAKTTPKAKATAKPAASTTNGAMLFNQHSCKLAVPLEALGELSVIQKLYTEFAKETENSRNTQVRAMGETFTNGAEAAAFLRRKYGRDKGPKKKWEALTAYWYASTLASLGKLGCKLTNLKPLTADIANEAKLKADLAVLKKGVEPLKAKIVPKKAEKDQTSGDLTTFEALRKKRRKTKAERQRLKELGKRYTSVTRLGDLSVKLASELLKLEGNLSKLNADIKAKSDQLGAVRKKLQSGKTVWVCKDPNAIKKLVAAFEKYVGKYATAEEKARINVWLKRAQAKTWKNALNRKFPVTPLYRFTYLQTGMCELPQSKIAHLTDPDFMKDRLGTLKKGCKDGDFCRAQTPDGLHYGIRDGDTLKGTAGTLKLTAGTKLLHADPTLIGRLSGRKWLANLGIELGYSVLGSLVQDDHLAGVSLHMIRVGLANRFNLGSSLFITPHIHGGFAFVNGDSIARSNLGGDTSSGDRFRGVLALGAKFGVKLSRNLALYGVGEFLAFPGLGGSGGLGVDIDVSSGVRLSADLRWTSIPDTGVSSGKRPDLRLGNVGANGMQGNLTLSF